MSASERAHTSGFKLGSRVRLSKLGRARCPTMAPRGTVVGFSRRSTALQVLMDGNKTSVLLHLSYLELARQPAQPKILAEGETHHRAEQPLAVIAGRDSSDAP